MVSINITVLNKIKGLESAAKKLLYGITFAGPDEIKNSSLSQSGEDFDDPIHMMREFKKIVDQISMHIDELIITNPSEDENESSQPSNNPDSTSQAVIAHENRIKEVKARIEDREEQIKMLSMRINDIEMVLDRVAKQQNIYIDKTQELDDQMRELAEKKRHTEESIDLLESEVSQMTNVVLTISGEVEDLKNQINDIDSQDRGNSAKRQRQNDPEDTASRKRRL